jgi:hypothetical protein
VSVNQPFVLARSVSSRPILAAIRPTPRRPTTRSNPGGGHLWDTITAQSVGDPQTPNPG